MEADPFLGGVRGFDPLCCFALLCVKYGGGRRKRCGIGRVEFGRQGRHSYGGGDWDDIVRIRSENQAISRKRDQGNDDAFGYGGLGFGGRYRGGPDFRFGKRVLLRRNADLS